MSGKLRFPEGRLCGAVWRGRVSPVKRNLKKWEGVLPSLVEVKRTEKNGRSAMLET